MYNEEKQQSGLILSVHSDYALKNSTKECQ